jgi:hypothetical protein
MAGHSSVGDPGIFIWSEHPVGLDFCHFVVWVQASGVYTAPTEAQLSRTRHPPRNVPPSGLRSFFAQPEAKQCGCAATCPSRMVGFAAPVCPRLSCSSGSIRELSSCTSLLCLLVPGAVVQCDWTADSINIRSYLIRLPQCYVSS